LHYGKGRKTRWDLRRGSNELPRAVWNPGLRLKNAEKCFFFLAIGEFPRYSNVSFVFEPKQTPDTVSRTVSEPAK
jgi:hypothetical protein